MGIRIETDSPWPQIHFLSLNLFSKEHFLVSNLRLHRNMKAYKNIDRMPDDGRREGNKRASRIIPRECKCCIPATTSRAALSIERNLLRDSLLSRLPPKHLLRIACCRVPSSQSSYTQRKIQNNLILRQDKAVMLRPSVTQKSLSHL